MATKKFKPDFIFSSKKDLSKSVKAFKEADATVRTKKLKSAIPSRGIPPQFGLQFKFKKRRK